MARLLLLSLALLLAVAGCVNRPPKSVEEAQRRYRRAWERGNRDAPHHFLPRLPR